MITIQSAIEGIQTRFGELKKLLTSEDFHLGGGYDYDHGYMDRALDLEEEHGYHYYLRIPLYVIDGELESDDATIRLGRPFVIRHEFRTGNDPEGEEAGVASALINQFSEPIPVDQDNIDPEWINRARSVIGAIEQKLVH
jgi:hypothetical protein